MHNTRGNIYSQGHVTLDSCVTCSEYWDFGLHEQALFDYPAVIDYVLNETKESKLGKAFIEILQFFMCRNLIGICILFRFHWLFNGNYSVLNVIVRKT